MKRGRGELEPRLDKATRSSPPSVEDLEPYHWEYRQDWNPDRQRRMVGMRLPPVIIRALHWLRDQPAPSESWRRQSFANIVAQLVAARVAELRPNGDRRTSSRGSSGRGRRA